MAIAPNPVPWSLFEVRISRTGTGSGRGRAPVYGRLGVFSLALALSRMPHRALRRIGGLLAFLLVFCVLAGACQRYGVGGFLLLNSLSSLLLLAVRLPLQKGGAKFRSHLPRGQLSGPWFFSTAEARTSNSQSSFHRSFALLLFESPEGSRRRHVIKDRGGGGDGREARRAMPATLVLGRTHAIDDCAVRAHNLLEACRVRRDGVDQPRRGRP